MVTFELQGAACHETRALVAQISDGQKAAVSSDVQKEVMPMKQTSGVFTKVSNWLTKHHFVIVLVLSLAHIVLAALPHPGRPLSRLPELALP
jgi:hypothetical protein